MVLRYFAVRVAAVGDVGLNVVDSTENWTSLPNPGWHPFAVSDFQLENAVEAAAVLESFDVQVVSPNFPILTYWKLVIAFVRSLECLANLSPDYMV